MPSAALSIDADIPYAEYASGPVATTGPFAVPFPLPTDYASALKVSIDGVETTDYVFTPDSDVGIGFPTGSIALVYSTHDTTVRVWREIPVERTSDFATGPLDMDALNTEMGRFTMMLQDVRLKAALIWREGAGVPSDSLGSDGDMYVNSTTGDLYGPKDNGAWGSVVMTLKGDTGGVTGDGSAVMVKSTGSVTARTLAARFAETVNVQDFGAVFDGASHPLSDTYSTLAAAQAVYPFAVSLSDEIDWAASQKAVNLGGTIVWPSGTGLFNRQLEVGDGTAAAASTLQNIQLIGRTVPAGNQLSTQMPGTRIKFTGANNTNCIFRLNGPMTIIVDGFTFDCNFLAKGGVWSTHIFRSRIRNCYVGKHRAKAWYFDAWETTVGVTTGSTINVLDNCHCGEPGTSSTTAIKIGGDTGTYGSLDVARFVVQNCSFLCGNSLTTVGMHFAFCDQVIVRNTFVISSAASAPLCVAKLFKITAIPGFEYFPQNMLFEYAYFICDGVDGYDIDPAWVSQNGRGAMFWPFMRGEVETCTNPVPSHSLLWGITDSGVYFGTQLLSPALTAPTAATAEPGTNTTQLATTAFVVAGDALKANIASPTFTGVPAAPTAAPGTNTTQLSTTAFVKAAIDALLGGAPGALDTLKELADAINDDASYAAAITTALGLKAPLASPALTGTPTAPTAAASDNSTKLATTAYVDAVPGIGTWKVLKASGLAVSRNSVNGAGDATETVAATVTVPANSVGANGLIRVTSLWSFTNSATVKTLRTRLGGLSGTIVESSTPTTNVTLRRSVEIFSQNSTSAQVAMATGGQAGNWGLTTGAKLTAAKDMTASQDIVFTTAWPGATAGENITLEYYLVEVFKSA